MSAAHKIAVVMFFRGIAQGPRHTDRNRTGLSKASEATAQLGPINQDAVPPIEGVDAARSLAQYGRLTPLARFAANGGKVLTRFQKVAETRRFLQEFESCQERRPLSDCSYTTTEWRRKVQLSFANLQWWDTDLSGFPLSGCNWARTWSRLREESRAFSRCSQTASDRQVDARSASGCGEP